MLSRYILLKLCSRAVTAEQCRRAGMMVGLDKTSAKHACFHIRKTAAGWCHPSSSVWHDVQQKLRESSYRRPCMPQWLFVRLGSGVRSHPAAVGAGLPSLWSGGILGRPPVLAAAAAILFSVGLSERRGKMAFGRRGTTVFLWGGGARGKIMVQ